MTSKRSTLRDNSWIRRADEEDEDVDRDPNFAKSVLTHYRSSEDLLGSDDEESTTKSGGSSSVHDLTKRFSGSADDLIESSYSSPKSTTTHTVTKDGYTETVTTTTTQKSNRFTDRVKSSSKEAQYTTYGPTRTKVTETVISSKDAEDKLYDTLIPSSIKSYSTADKTNATTTETVIVRSSSDLEAEDKLYDTLRDDFANTESKTTVTETVTVKSSNDGYHFYTEEIPSIRTTTYTTRTLPMDDYSIDRKSYSYSRPDSSYEYSSLTSPTTYTTTSYRSSSRSDGILSEAPYSRNSIKSVYSSTERLDRDLCTHCHKPFTGEAKMVLDDMNINCHATCFKCQVCNSNLGHMKAGDSLWVYRKMVYCENCFDNTREKWKR